MAKDMGWDEAASALGVRYSVRQFGGRRPGESVLIDGRVSANVRVLVKLVDKDPKDIWTSFWVFVRCRLGFSLERKTPQARPEIVVPDAVQKSELSIDLATGDA